MKYLRQFALILFAIFIFLLKPTLIGAGFAFLFYYLTGGQL